MNKILKDWYEGNLTPCENIIPKDREYPVFLHRISQKREHFKNTLPPEERILFEKLEQEVLRVSLLDSYANFSYGFRLAVQLLSESMTFPLNE